MADISLDELMRAQTGADDTLRHNEARRQGRRLLELEMRFEHVIATIDVQQDALAKLIGEREVDRAQIEKLIASNADLRGSLDVIKSELFFIKRDIAVVNETLGGLVDG